MIHLPGGGKRMGELGVGGKERGRHKHIYYVSQPEIRIRPQSMVLGLRQLTANTSAKRINMERSIENVSNEHTFEYYSPLCHYNRIIAIYYFNSQSLCTVLDTMKILEHFSSDNSCSISPDDDIGR